MGNMIKWIRNNIVKVHVSVIILCVVAFGFYGVHVRQYRMYKEYNDMKGVVTAVFKTKTCYMINARLDNGVCGSANVGYDSYEVGDVYINSVHYDRIIRATGNAYYICPPSDKILTTIESSIVGFTYIGVIGFSILIYVLWLTNQNNKHKKGDR
jgi:hypothetical protein